MVNNSKVIIEMRNNLSKIKFRIEDKLYRVSKVPSKEGDLVLDTGDMTVGYHEMESSGLIGVRGLHDSSSEEVQKKWIKKLVLNKRKEWAKVKRLK